MFEVTGPLAKTVSALALRESCEAFVTSIEASSSGTLELVSGQRSSAYVGGNRPLGLAIAKWTARLYGTCASGRPAFSPQLSAVLHACLTPNPALRPSMAEVLRMPFFAEAQALTSADTAFLAERLEAAREERVLRALSPTLSRTLVLDKDLEAPPCLDETSSLSLDAQRPLRVAPHAALHALFGAQGDCFRQRAMWITQLCLARQRLSLPPACVLYAIDFVDRVAAAVLPEALKITTCAALHVAQIVCCDFSNVARLRGLMKALDAPPEQSLADTREACCRLLASLHYTVHGGGAEPPQQWSSWAALRAPRGGEPTVQQVSMALVVLCLWPLHGPEAGVDRAQAMGACIEAIAGTDVSQQVGHVRDLLAALSNAEDFRSGLEALLRPAPEPPSSSPCSSITALSGAEVSMKEE